MQWFFAYVFSPNRCCKIKYDCVLCSSLVNIIRSLVLWNIQFVIVVVVVEMGGGNTFSLNIHTFLLLSAYEWPFFFSVLFDSFAYSYAVICNVFLIRMPYLYERLWYIFLFAYEIKFEWTLCVKMSDVQCLLNCKSDLSSTDWLHMTYNNK